MSGFSTLQTFCFSLSSVSYTLLRLLNELSSHKLTKNELKKYLAEINILTYPLKILVPIPHNMSSGGGVDEVSWLQPGGQLQILGDSHVRRLFNEGKARLEGKVLQPLPAQSFLLWLPDIFWSRVTSYSTFLLHRFNLQKISRSNFSHIPSATWESTDCAVRFALRNKCFVCLWCTVGQQNFWGFLV